MEVANKLLDTQIDCRLQKKRPIWGVFTINDTAVFSSCSTYQTQSDESLGEAL